MFPGWAEIACSMPLTTGPIFPVSLGHGAQWPRESLGKAGGASDLLRHD